MTNLEELVRDLADEADGPKALLREHLEAARFYDIEAMPEEFRFNLKLIKDVLPQIEDRNLRTRVMQFLASNTGKGGHRT